MAVHANGALRCSMVTIFKYWFDFRPSAGGGARWSPEQVVEHSSVVFVVAFCLAAVRDIAGKSVVLVGR